MKKIIGFIMMWTCLFSLPLFSEEEAQTEGTNPVISVSGEKTSAAEDAVNAKKSKKAAKSRRAKRTAAVEKAEAAASEGTPPVIAVSGDQSAPSEAAPESAKKTRKSRRAKRKESATPEAADAFLQGQEELDPKTGFPKIKNRPFVMFNEGVAFDMLTRFEKQKERSNFVRENYFAGLYFSMQTENMKPINSMIRVAAYYPFANTFNGMAQYPKQPILYAFDLFVAPMIQADMWKYVRLNFAGGPHYKYQLTDEYHMNYLGLGLLAGVELPLAPHWTILTDGTFAADYPNLGTNRLVQPFTLAWQYNVSVGMRYSRRGRNEYSYIHKIQKKARVSKKQAEADATAVHVD